MDFEIDNFQQLEEQLLILQKHKKDVQLKEMIQETSQELILLEQDYTRDYLKKIQNILDLHSELQSVDDILLTMLQQVESFKTSISLMNSEISHLHSSTTEMDTKLQNRLKAYQYLTTDLEGIVISPDLIKKICEGEVNDFFLVHLQDLDSKLECYSKNPEKAKAFKTTGPELERLLLKATEKIRDFLLKKIDSLKEPNTNIALIQQNVFCKYKQLFWFLMERSELVGLEVHQNYIYTVSTYFSTQFEKYIKSILRFQVGHVDKNDLMGAEERKSGGLFGKAVVKEATQIFGLGNRINVLTLTDAGIIIPHHAEEQNKKFTFEAIFKSINRLLIDNACSEYIFTCDFFNKNGKQHVDSLQTFFLQVFDPTLKLVQNAIKMHVDTWFDAIGVLICIRLNQQHIRILQKRLLPHLDNFLNLVNMLLWPKFQAIMGMHIDSLKKADPKKLITKDPTVHFIVRRYAEFSCSILVLNQGFEDGLLLHSLSRLRTETESLLYRLAAEFPDKKLSLAFWINNMDCILQTMNQYNVSSFDQEKEYFQKLHDEKSMDFVMHIIGEFVGAMLEVNQKHERKQPITRELMEKVAADFQQGWKSWVALIHDQIMAIFSNFQIGGRLLHLGLTQFVLQYKVFLGIWEEIFKGSKSKMSPVGIQSVLVEIKKFKSNYQ